MPKRRTYDHIIETFDDNLLKPYFVKFIELKKGKGEIVADSVLYNMKYINNYLVCNENDNLSITKDAVWTLLQKKEHEKGIIPASLVSILRQFLSFMLMYSPDTYQLPENAFKSPPKPFHSFVFTENELNAIVEYVDAKTQERRYIKHGIHAYPFILRMLIGTGMRISEVIDLEMKNLDFQKNVVNVLDSKSHVSRFIPISNSLSKSLMVYAETARKNAASDSPFFVSTNTGSFCSYEAFRIFMMDVFKAVGVIPRNGQKPTIHSFRHTFCTRSLNRMLSSGLDFYTAVPILSAYMGHTNTIDTEKYIHLIGMKEIDFIDQEESISSLIPEVEDYE
jgi:integrase/recombinase XerD